ncbi:hypothetical protein K437DRAFT_275575 [Tilletiaria anomala UBC 951]|uniref:Uncharacterized protein n=1 Tax=Tilletiaria anomala (strain ATCC 24038 / CBS 436.72 / UBC 951) TaxID=1037660 RepID=A0A066VHJ8_TILAU|nr:uncharacterized protein K437DRAFT_275575 [Tilletiaria anomala UBC 951]KDN40951.1 hypothetical protein K437DRAFT_275575 [Tilletiaria anomala UBC 951]
MIRRPPTRITISQKEVDEVIAKRKEARASAGRAGEDSEMSDAQQQRPALQGDSSANDAPTCSGRPVAGGLTSLLAVVAHEDSVYVSILEMHRTTSIASSRLPRVAEADSYETTISSRMVALVCVCKAGRALKSHFFPSEPAILLRSGPNLDKAYHMEH